MIINIELLFTWQLQVRPPSICVVLYCSAPVESDWAHIMLSAAESEWDEGTQMFNNASGRPEGCVKRVVSLGRFRKLRFEGLGRNSISLPNAVPSSSSQHQIDRYSLSEWAKRSTAIQYDVYIRLVYIRRVSIEI